MMVKERDLFSEYSKKYYENAAEDYEFMNPTIAQYVNVRGLNFKLLVL